MALLLVDKSEFSKFNDDYGLGDHLYFSLHLVADLIMGMKPAHYQRHPNQIQTLEDDLVKTANEIYDECLSGAESGPDSVTRGITIWRMTGWFDESSFNLEILVDV